MLDDVRRHVSARGRALVGLVCVGALLAGLTTLDDPSVEAVAHDLAVVSGATVEPGAFVWGPSRGWLADLRGRDVYFVGGRGPDGLGDVFRARVVVLPSGRPLFVHHVEALTHSEAAVEGDLVVTPERVAFAARHEGRVVAVEVAGHGGGERIVVAPPLGAREVRWELSPEGVLLDVDGAAVAVDEGAVVSPPGGVAAARLPDERVPVARPPWGGPSSPQDAVVAAFERRAGEAASEPEGDAVPLPPGAPDGAPAAVVRAAHDGGELVRFDGRQLVWSLAPGTLRPRTDTGRRPVRRLAEDWAELARIVWDPPLNGEGSASMQSIDGRFRDGPPSGAVLSIDASGQLHLGNAVHVDAMQWIVPLGHTGAERGSAWCATASGDLVWATGAPERTLDALPGDCVGVISFPGPSRLEVGPFEARPEGPSVSLAWRSFAPVVPPPRGTSWRVLADAAATPTWAPSAHEVVELSRLGTRVTVRRFDVTRYVWALRAGTKERAHRKGGTFPQALGADAPRARVALGMGFGKRRGPRGLRIDGSTGLVFASRDLILLGGDGRLELVGASPGVEETAPQATALRATVDDGRLLAGARERGPRQLRADVCVRGRELLVAEAVFDSHEATASVLVELGCARAAALDRGSEPRASSRLGPSAADPAEGTALVGLDRSMPGTVSAGP